MRKHESPACLFRMVAKRKRIKISIRNIFDTKDYRNISKEKLILMVPSIANIYDKNNMLNSDWNFIRWL